MQCTLQAGLFRAYALRITGVAGEHQLVNIKQYNIASNSSRLKMAILAYNPIMQQPPPCPACITASLTCERGPYIFILWLV